MGVTQHSNNLSYSRFVEDHYWVTQVWGQPTDVWVSKSRRGNTFVAGDFDDFRIASNWEIA